MSQLAKVELVVAPACPNCRQRIADLNLDRLAGGAEHQCLFCGHFMKIPGSILERLLAQRDAARAAAPPRRSVLARLSDFVSRMLGR
jgi:hypothetical protein